MISDRLQTFIPKIIDYFKNEPILRAWIFGSYSRNEQNDTSDIDILVDYDRSKPISLLKICGMMIELEDILGVKVDLVENGRVKDFAVDSVNKDKILFYERTA